MNCSSRNSSSTSPSVRTVLPTTTAMRSRTPADDKRTNINSTKTVRISKRLSNRKEELKVTDVLDGRSSGIKQELLVGAFQTHKRGRIYAVRQVHTDRADRSAVTDSEPGRMHHVIEI